MMQLFIKKKKEQDNSTGDSVNVNPYNRLTSMSTTNRVNRHDKQIVIPLPLSNHEN